MKAADRVQAFLDAWSMLPRGGPVTIESEGRHSLTVDDLRVLLAERKVLDGLLREVWVRLDRQHVTRFDLGGDLAKRIRSLYEGEEHEDGRATTG